MTGRDLRWRAGGVALAAAAGAAALLADRNSPSWGLLAFALALAGVILLIQGRHVPLAFRVERGRHRHLPSVLRARHTDRARHRR